MAKTFHIMNADLYQVAGVSPRASKRGDTFALPDAVSACPWLPGDKLIPAGSYRIVSKKHFAGGSIEVEALTAASL